MNCEILSPVGNKEMLIAAVRSGADAVYLGLKDFSARRNAENFDFEELKEAIEYCHKRNVKVYLALNIILKENELEAAFYAAQKAYNLGVDAIIIADLGLVRLLNKYIPELTLHASTQMCVHSPSALPFLKKLGFKRVVVSREMSKSDLWEFCQKAKALGIEVEVFVHGALCMCLSGQCLLSAFLGARSGNRGLCAGPCRLPFKAKNGTGYDLSLKDLSLLPYLAELKEMGVCSFKIEGRMKRPEYVAAATAAAKESLENGKTNDELSQILKDVFSRQGFTDGYYVNSLGVNMFGTRTKEDVLAGNKAFPCIHSLYKNERQNIGIKIYAHIEENKPISVKFACGATEAFITSDIPQKAKTKAIDEEFVKTALSKLGDTPFFAEEIEIHLNPGLFVSNSLLNGIRRSLSEMLQEKFKKEILPNNLKLNEEYKVKKSEKQKLIIRVSDASQIPESLENVDGIIYPIENDINKIKDSGVQIIADIPRFILNEKLVIKRLEIFKENGVEFALCPNLAAIELAKSLSFKIWGDSPLNIANSSALSLLEAEEIDTAIISVEQTLKDIASLKTSLKKGIIAYGKIPLMVFKNCPIKNGISCDKCDKSESLTDRLGTKFPIRCRMGYSRLLNQVPIWLGDKAEEIKEMDYIILWFETETKSETENIINAFIEHRKFDGDFTRGLYFKGVI